MLAGWEDIRAVVVLRFLGFVWFLGAVFGFVEALANEFGVARATVNRALRELATEGVRERRRRDRGRAARARSGREGFVNGQ